MSDDNDQALRDIVKGAGVVYVGLFLELAIAFVAQIIAARYLSAGGFGGITAGTALLDLGAILGGLGLASGLTRYLPRIEAGDKRMLTTVVIVVSVCTSLVLGVVVVLTAPFLATEVFGSPNITVSIKVFGGAIPLATLLNVSIGGIRGQEKSLYRVYVKNIIHPVARIGLVVAAVYYGLGQAGMAGAYALPYLVSSVLALWLLHRSLPTARSAVDQKLLTEVTRYSLPFTVSRVSGFVYRSLDIFLVLYFLGDAATGVYGVAYAAVSFMGIYSTAFNFLGAPIASRLEKDGPAADVIQLFRSVARWLVIASVCTLVPLGVFATDFITVIYTAEYQSGGAVLALLAVGFAIKNVLSIHNPILEALGRSKTLSFNSAVAAIMNAVLNIALIPLYGIEGAAVATVLSFLLRDGLATLQVYITVGSSPLSWRSSQPAVVALPFLLGVIAFSEFIPGTFLWLVTVTAVTASIYVGVIVVVFGLSATEVMIVESAQDQYGVNIPLFDRIVDVLSR
jgi:O-antigen/teichoic acid export membrane protein